MSELNGAFLFYENDFLSSKIEVRLENESVWLSQSQMADLFKTSKANINIHLKNIFKEGELNQHSVIKEYLTTAMNAQNLFFFHFLYIFLYLFMYINALIMLTASISDFRKDIKRYLDKVSQNFETLIIHRGKDDGIVIISLAEYNSLCATQHELSSKRNQDRLDSAIEQMKSGNIKTKKLIEE